MGDGITHSVPFNDGEPQPMQDADIQWCVQRMLADDRFLIHHGFKTNHDSLANARWYEAVAWVGATRVYSVTGSPEDNMQSALVSLVEKLHKQSLLHEAFPDYRTGIGKAVSDPTPEQIEAWVRRLPSFIISEGRNGHLVELWYHHDAATPMAKFVTKRGRRPEVMREILEIARRFVAQFGATINIDS